MTETRAATWALPALLVLCAALFALQVDLARPPAALGLDARPHLFSAERAKRDLAHLLGDEAAHPVGSEANRAVRDRLLERLAALGVLAELQTTTGCAAEHATCARVTNVIAEIPGESERAIALMAHYDSVAAAPGAGDDGAGVAAILEIARVVLPGAPYRNSILLIFTDAEEAGLLGAEAFFVEHPAASRVEAVINLECRGNSGPVFLFRTGPSSGHLLDAFRRVAPAPLAQSVTEEVFRRLPNDTDLSVAIRAGLPGADFACIGTPVHYHTPLDAVANLDLGTIQHHGDNALPLLRALADTDLTARSPGYVYANLGKRLWLHWPTSMSLPIALAGLLLLAIATGRLRPRPLHLLAAATAGFVIAITSVLVTLAALLGIDRLTGVRPAWPADPWPWRVVVYGTPVFLLALAGPWLVRRLGGGSLFLGVWWVFALVTVAVAATAPLAAYLFAAPLFSAALLAMLASLRPSGRVHAAGIGLIAAILPAWFLLAMTGSMEDTQGFSVAAALAAPLALLLLVVLPVAAHDPGRAVTLAAAGTILLGFAMAALVEPYSPLRPQHLNVTWLQEADGATARIVIASPDPLPARIRDAVALERAQAYPWEAREHDVALAAPDALEAPVLNPLEPADGFVRFRITPAPGALATLLWIPRARIADEVRIDDRTTTTAPRRDRAPSEFRRIAFVAAPPEGFVVGVKPVEGEGATAFLVAAWPGLPLAASEIAARRGELAVPAHTGDQTLAFRRVAL